MQSNRNHSKLTAAIGICIIVFWMAGCSAKTPVTSVIFKASSQVNEGQPVYVLIRTTNSNEFVTEDYMNVAKLVLSNPVDKSVISTDLIMPGDKKKVKFEKPDNQSVGIYCMFTRPDGQWKVLLPKPLKKKYKIHIKKNDIVLKK